MKLNSVMEKLVARWRRWRRKRRWPAERQVERAWHVIDQDRRWMAHDPKVRALCDRYLKLLADDWESQSVEDVGAFRRRIGCDPWIPKGPQ